MPYLSDCCDALVLVEGEITQFWRCTRCRKPCGTNGELSEEVSIVFVGDDDAGLAGDR